MLLIKHQIIDEQSFTVSELASGTDELGTVIAKDPEEGSLSFSISVNDNDLFEITTEGALSLATGKSLDFETASSHSITVQVSDGTLSTDGIITILVTNVAEADEFFITTWETTTPNESITIPVNDSEFSYNYEVHWGDGSSDVNQDGSASHTYTTAGTYTVKIAGNFPAIRFAIQENSDKIKTIEQWGNTSWKSMTHAFKGCQFLTYNATDNPILSEVTAMEGMF